MRSQQDPLQRLTLIRQVSKKPGKVTGQYKIASKPTHVKNKVIVKQYALTGTNVNAQLLQKQLEEVSRIQQFHPIEEIFIKKDGDSSVCIVVEGYHPYGNLTQAIHDEAETDYEICHSIVELLAKLHQNGITHLNLKPQNILLSKDGKSVKFTDAHIPCLGMNNLVNKQSCYVSPQCQQYFEDDTRSDIWSLGIIFLQMFLHRRITTNETSIENLKSLIKLIPNKMLRNLLNGMCCEKERRFPIGQILQVLKKIINQENEDFMPYSFMTIRIPLISLDEDQEADLNATIQKEIFEFKQWSIAFQLFKTKANFALSLVFQRQIIKISKLYTSLPVNLVSIFTNLEELFNRIREADRQYFDLQNDGSFSLRMKINQQEEQPKAQKKQQNTVENAAEEITISTEKVAVKQKDNIVQLKQELNQPFEEKKEARDNLYIDEKDESDEEQEILTGHTKFPVDQPIVRRILTTIRIAVSLQQPNQQLISTLYQKLGKQLEQQPALAISAFKLARYGYTKLFGRNNDKNMTLLINLGVAYAKALKYPKATACFKRSVLIANLLNDQKIAFLAYQNWGSIALACNDYGDAENCFLHCSEISDKSPEDKQMQTMAYDNLANLYLKHEKYEKSVIWLQRALNLQANRPTVDIGVLTFNLAFSLLHIRNIRLAFEKFKDAFKINFASALRQQLQNLFILQISSRKPHIKELPFNLKLDVKKSLSQQGQQRFQDIVQLR